MIKEGIRLIKAEGFKSTLKEFLKDHALYGRLDKILDFWAVYSTGLYLEEKTIQGSKMLLNLKDRGVPRELYIRGIREDKATKIVQSWLRPDMIVIEAGSNIGYYALMEARVVSKVYAIEPDLRNYSGLLINIDLNKYTNIEPMNFAVGDLDGRASLQKGLSMSWHRISTDFGAPSDRLVEVRKLDTLFPDIHKVDLLRMDVEGYEVRILKGAENLLRRCKPKLFIEAHIDLMKDYDNSLTELFNLLEVFNYSITHSFIGTREGPKGYPRNLIDCNWGQSVHLFLE